MRGEVVYVFVYDAGGRIDLDRVSVALGGRPGFSPVEIAKAAPKYLALPRPLLLSFPELSIVTTMGGKSMSIVAKLYDVGAVSLVFRVPFEEAALADVGRYGEIRVVDEGGTVALGQYAKSFFERIRTDLSPALLDRYDVRVVPEEYTIFCVTEPDVPVSELLSETTHRARLAALLAGEPRADKLSGKEVDENLQYWYSYYEDDAVIVDWDNALIVDPSGRYDDVLLVLELANVQLLELRVYDQYLDRILEKAYSDLERFFNRAALLASPERILKEIADARIDLTRVTDLVENIGKMFGDYYLAKVYLSVNERFHIPKWQSVVNSKIRTLNDLYVMANQELQARRNLTLEFMIVLLFIIDLAIIAIPFLR